MGGEDNLVKRENGHAFLISKKQFPCTSVSQPHQKAALTRGGGEGNNATQVHCSQKSCIAIGREVAPVRNTSLDGSFLFSVWRGHEGALQALIFVGDQGDQAFVFFLELSK